MRVIFNNFWICLAFALWCVCLSAVSAQMGDISWAWVLGILGVLWLNDARRALNRDKETLDGEKRTPEG